MVETKTGVMLSVLLEPDRILSRDYRRATNKKEKCLNLSPLKSGGLNNITRVLL